MHSSLRRLLGSWIVIGSALAHLVPASPAQAQAASGEVRWRRTAEGWERADGWLVEARVSQAEDSSCSAGASAFRCAKAFHPALLAALQLAVSCGALGALRPECLRRTPCQECRPHLWRRRQESLHVQGRSHDEPRGPSGRSAP